MTITKDGVIVAISIIYFIGWLFVIFMKYKNRFLSFTFTFLLAAMLPNDFISH